MNQELLRRFASYRNLILFFLLAIRNWTGSSIIGMIAGWEGIICGSSAVYLAMAEVLEESRGKKILPF